MLKIRNPERPEVRRAIYRAVRRAKSLSASEAARQLGLPKRTYEYFEGGDARFDFRRLEIFGDALDIDAQALLLAMMLDRPQFAVRAGGTHLVTVALRLCAELEDRLGDDLARLDGPTITRVLSSAFEGLAKEAEQRTFR